MTSDKYFNGLFISLVALFVWSPLKPIGETEFRLLGELTLNWLAALITIGSYLFAYDFSNFSKPAKVRHYAIAVLLAPIWAFARLLMTARRATNNYPSE